MTLEKCLLLLSITCSCLKAQSDPGCYLQTGSSSHLGRLKLSFESRQIGSSCGCWLGSSCGRLRQASGEELQHLEKKESWLKHWDESNMNTLRANPAATLFASSLFALCFLKVVQVLSDQLWNTDSEISCKSRASARLRVGIVQNGWDSGKSGLLFLRSDPLGLSWCNGVSKHVGAAC